MPPSSATSASARTSRAGAAAGPTPRNASSTRFTAARSAGTAASCALPDCPVTRSGRWARAICRHRSQLQTAYPDRCAMASAGSARQLRRVNPTYLPNAGWVSSWMGRSTGSARRMAITPNHRHHHQAHHRRHHRQPGQLRSPRQSDSARRTGIGPLRKLSLTTRAALFVQAGIHRVSEKPYHFPAAQARYNSGFMAFIHDDFLLTTHAARRLYHEFAAAEPILDYHCHLPPKGRRRKSPLP